MVWPDCTTDPDLLFRNMWSQKVWGNLRHPTSTPVEISWAFTDIHIESACWISIIRCTRREHGLGANSRNCRIQDSQLKFMLGPKISVKHRKNTLFNVFADFSVTDIHRDRLQNKNLNAPRALPNLVWNIPGMPKLGVWKLLMLSFHTEPYIILPHHI